MATHVLSLMNTIKKYNGTKCVHPGPAESTNCGNLFPLEQLTHWAAHMTCKNQE